MIEPWEEAKTVTVRLAATGLQNVELNKAFERLERIYVEEIMLTGVGGSGAHYLRLDHNNLTDASIKNEPVAGLMICVDVLNPHVVYPRPRLISHGNMTNLQQFQVGFFTPAGAALAFTEASVVLTFVSRKPAASHPQVRQWEARQDYPPSIKDFARNTYEP